jgi:hypothetical protein
MCCGTLSTGEYQHFYFPEDHPTMPNWFKGMEQIIRECGLWPEVGLPAQCPGFKCPRDRADCCCRHVLYLQPDFTAQCSQLQELIASCGHICDFYPKYHCELNFIEQYWGAAKSQYHMVPQAKTLHEMENTVEECLDNVPLLQIRRFALFFCFCSIAQSIRFANRAAHFVTAYREGLSGAQAAWANKKYHGHRTLPPQHILEARDTIT